MLNESAMPSKVLWPRLIFYIVIALALVGGYHWNMVASDSSSTWDYWPNLMMVVLCTAIAMMQLLVVVVFSISLVIASLTRKLLVLFQRHRCASPT